MSLEGYFPVAVKEVVPDFEEKSAVESHDSAAFYVKNVVLMYGWCAQGQVKLY